jgi:hypothetical protein
VLRIGGGSAAPAALRKALEAFAPDQRTMSIVWEAGTADTRRVVEGTLDALLVATGPAGPDSTTPLHGAVASVELLRTPVVFLVAAGSAERESTSGDLIALYALQRTQWRDGSRTRIVLRPARSVDARALKALSPEWRRAVSALEQRPGMVVASRALDAIDLVAEVPGALTATTLPATSFARRPVRTLVIDGAAPTAAAVASGQYRLYSSIHVLVAMRRQDLASGLAAHLRSERFRSAFGRAGHVVPDPSGESAQRR